MNDASNALTSIKGVILIVDDTAAHRLLFEDMLKSEGYVTLSAENGLSALSQARSAHPDLILLDICLPDMDGYTVCSTLKCNPKTRDIPIVFVSALDTTIDLARAFEVGGVDYLVKPVQPLEMSARVRNQLQFRRIQAQLIEQNLRLQQEIRKRYHVENELSANRERWHLALQGSNDGLWDWDIANGSMYFSERWQEIVGHEPGTLLPQRRSWQELVHPEDLEWVLEFIRYHLECVTTHYYAEYRLRHKSGQYRWVLDRGQAQWDDRRNPIRMSGSLTDVTLRHQSEEQLQLLLATGQAVVQADTFQEMLEIVLGKLCTIAEWDAGEAWSIDEPSGRLQHRMGWHSSQPGLEAIQQMRTGLFFSENQGFPGYVWALQEGIWVEDIESGGAFASHRSMFREAGLHSAYGVPIFADRQVVAVLVFFSCGRRSHNTRAIELTQAVASQLSSFMLRQQTKRALTEANTELQRLVTLDGLTQLANRRKFDDYIHTEWRRALRDGTPLALLMCDVDHFKRYNDYYGHQAGDACLRWVASVLEAQAKRITDLAARYGGEEFAIVLPNTDLSGAIAVAERVNQAVRDLKIPHEESPISDCVTVSIGAAYTTPLTGTLPTRLIARADRCLYQAKALGRNRVFVYKDDVLLSEGLGRSE